MPTPAFSKIEYVSVVQKVGRIAVGRGCNDLGVLDVVPLRVVVGGCPEPYRRGVVAGAAVTSSGNEVAAVAEEEHPERGQPAGDQQSSDDRDQAAAPGPRTPLRRSSARRRRGRFCSASGERQIRERVLVVGSQAGLERRDEGLGRGEPVLRALLHRRPNQLVDGGWHVGTSVADARHGVVQVSHRRLDEALGRERNLAGQELVEEDAERVLIRALADRIAGGLLRCQVVARSEQGPGRRETLFAVEGARDSEVRDLRGAFAVDDDVVRLHVPVDDAVAVGEGEPAGDLPDEHERVADGERPLAFDELLQRLALDVLEDDELVILPLAAVDNRDDVRVGEPRDGRCLAPKALDVLAVV